ncbi:NAD(P)/FAD-dependent oxidoreductase [Corticibacter populi]|uniref:Ferredoxin--NADP reductase n=1 Tax=Corticibacter populi TaxID=1550736 RepID=A0A3M6QLY9_9BURK|nr:NAD(P)/FAD-dependent oxidoreductase [Corticibacter populi]RMX03432.1 NAD(P)/FAD-dependent oxidoreductase [Corticibacter populi]RZS29867.1 thioredoxin reductase (NADPH) [Corticibacter populi]
MHSEAAPISVPLETEVVVIGAGPAGLFQLFQLGLQGLACHAIEALPHPGGQCAELYPHKPIYDIPALPACSGAELAERLHAQLAPFAIDWHWGQQVTGLRDQPDGRLLVETAQGLRITAQAVVLALGAGAFVPRKPRLEGLEALLASGHQVFLQSHDRLAPVAGARVLIHGGDETAVAKALTLAALPAEQAPQSIGLLHRRDVFKADARSLQTLQALRAQGRIRVHIGQPEALLTSADATPDGRTRLQALQILDAEGNTQELPIDVLLVYQGISPKLGEALDWGLAQQNKYFIVDPATQRSSRTGVYAIGDIAHYPGKRKLIASAFHEAIMAGFALAEQLRGQPVLLQYTTTSTQLLERLGKPAAARD